MSFANGPTPSAAAIAWAYREWLLAEAVGEAASRCGRVLAVRCELSQYLRDLTADWSVQRIQALMSGRIKGRARRHLLPLPLTPEEEAACGAFEWPILQFRTGGPSAVYDSPMTGQVIVDRSKLNVAELRTRFLKGEFKIDKQRMRRTLALIIEPVLGRRGGNPGCWRFVRNFGDVTVCTDIDFGSAGGGQFRYWHLFVKGTGADDVGLSSERILLSHINIFNLLGVETAQWKYMTEEDVPGAAQHLVDLCSYFLSSVPEILVAARQEQERRNLLS